MDTFEPLVNLLTVLTALSVAAERVTDILKMRNPVLRVRTLSPTAEKQREAAIAVRSLAVGIGLALLVKADFFEMLAHLDSPWKTLGWVSVDQGRWVRSTASSHIGPAMYAVGGCVITGFMLGFGSKFWHDILQAVTELRQKAQQRREMADANLVTAGGNTDGN